MSQKYIVNFSRQFNDYIKLVKSGLRGLARFMLRQKSLHTFIVFINTTLVHELEIDSNYGRQNKIFNY